MFPYKVLEAWLGTDFGPAMPEDISRLSAPQCVDLAEHLRSAARAPAALPRATRPGELRPNVTTMRALDLVWGPNNLMDRVCTLLTYTRAATAFDPLTFTVEEWATAPAPGWDSAELRELLAGATGALVELYPLVASGALDLLPPATCREFADGLPAFEVDPDLLRRYSQSGLSNAIGDFNLALGGRQPTGRFRGYQHLWEIRQDLALVERYPEILQPLFVAGFDADLAALLLERPTSPSEDHVAALAGFRFPTYQVTARKVAELRDLDEFQSWFQALSVALLNVDLSAQTIRDAQAFVHDTLTGPAQVLMKSFESHAWREVRRTGVERLVVGALTGLASVSVGATLATSVATGAASAAAGTAWSGFRARGRKTSLDMPFLSMRPDPDGFAKPAVILPSGPLF
jgi:hypothetical protein